MGWKKGQSGNPHGRPRKGKTFTDVLEKYGRQKTEEGITRKEVLAKTIWELALSGNIAAIKYIYDRTDGSPRQSLELGGDIKLPTVVGFYPEDYDHSTPENTDADSESEEI